MQVMKVYTRRQSESHILKQGVPSRALVDSFQAENRQTYGNSKTQNVHIYSHTITAEKKLRGGYGGARGRVPNPERSWESHLAWASVQFSSVAQSCPTLCDPMNHSTPGLPVHHQLPKSTQTHVHWVSDAIQPSHPLLSPSPTEEGILAK